VICNQDTYNAQKEKKVGIIYLVHKVITIQMEHNKQQNRKLVVSKANKFKIIYTLLIYLRS